MRDPNFANRYIAIVAFGSRRHQSSNCLTVPYLLRDPLQSNPTAMLPQEPGGVKERGRGKTNLGERGGSSLSRKLRNTTETNEGEHICPFLKDELNFRGHIYTGSRWRRRYAAHDV